LAEAGVPAHTLAVTFQFPDYHEVGDEWQKIDYDNMAKLDRMIALALVMWPIVKKRRTERAEPASLQSTPK